MEFTIKGDFTSPPQLFADGQPIAYAHLNVWVYPPSKGGECAPISNGPHVGLSFTILEKVEGSNLEVGVTYTAKASECKDGKLVLIAAKKEKPKKCPECGKVDCDCMEEAEGAKKYKMGKMAKCSEQIYPGGRAYKIQIMDEIAEGLAGDV